MITSSRITSVAVLMIALWAASVAADSKFLENEFNINDPAGSDSYPRADSNSEGTSMVVWECTQPSPEICARRMSLNGTPIGAEFIANQSKSGTQQSADVAIDEAGNSFIVWESGAGDDGDSYTIFGRLYDRHGQALTNEMILNTITEGRQRYPAVAWQPGRGWVVAWDSSHDFPNRVMMRRFNQNGTPKGKEQWVSRNPTGINIENGSNIQPDVAADANGNYVIAWEGPRVVEIIGGSEVFARRYRHDGQPLAKSFRIVTQAESQKGDPSVSVADNGEFVIAFHRGDNTVAARRYRANGTPRGAEFQLNQKPASTTAPAVTMLPNGGFLAAWTSGIGEIVSGRFSVMQRQFNANGSAVENEKVTSPLASRPAMTSDAAGDVLVSFHATGPNAGVRYTQTRDLCEISDTTACAQQDRFKIEAAFETKQGNAGVAIGDELTDETSTFWFFAESNIELAVKTLSACFNNRYWVFAAGATNVGVDLAVTDTESGVRHRWYNPVGQDYETVRETNLFPCNVKNSTVNPSFDSDVTHPGGNAMRTSSTELAPETANETISVAHSDEIHPDENHSDEINVIQAGVSNCNANANTLCLNNGRFEVKVSYQDQTGPGQGVAVPLSADSGYFWFFSAGNLEILVKVLDACSFANRFWVLGAGLTDLKLELRVRDTVSGQTRVYQNKAGQRFKPVIDNSAFLTCG